MAQKPGKSGHVKGRIGRWTSDFRSIASSGSEDRSGSVVTSWDETTPVGHDRGRRRRKTLRLVARYADACRLRPSPEIPRKLDVLRRHCEAEDRDYDEIERTCAFGFDVGENGEKAGELIGQLRWLSDMDIETVIGVVPNVDRIELLEIIGRKIVPAVADF
jgi:hypothetical protein